MPDFAQTLDLIRAETRTLLEAKGAAVGELDAQTAFLDGALPMDSLDLATLLVVLEERIGRDPFRAGFRHFTTMGELARLYVDDV